MRCWAWLLLLCVTADAEILDIGREGLLIPPAIERVVASPRDRELLRSEYLRETYVLRRAQLLEELISVDPAGSLQFLLQSSTDSAPVVRAAAARGLGRVGYSEPCGAALTRMLSDTDLEVRCEAARTGARLALPGLMESALSDGAEAVVRSVLLACDSPQAASVVASKWDAIPASLRADAVAAVGRFESDSSRRVILAALAGDEQEKLKALRAVARWRLSEASGAVETIVNGDSSSMLRRESIRAAGHVLEPARAQSIAFIALQDRDLTVRTAAVEVFRIHPAENAIPALVGQLSQPSQTLRIATREALVVAGNAALEPLARLLEDSNLQRRIDGSWVLGRMKSAHALPRHMRLLGDADWSVCAQAAESLGLIGDQQAGGAVAELLRRCQPLTRENAHACREAMIACARLNQRDVLPLITPLLADSDPGTRPLRVAAAWAFGVLGDASDSATCSQLLARLGDIYEVEDVKFESLKALGHLKYAPAAETLLAYAKGGQLGESAPLRWMAHWAYQQVTGKTISYEPPARELSPDVSVQELR